MDTARTAILVDYDMWRYFDRVKYWVKLREKNAALILLVSEPEVNDFEWDDTRNPPDTPEWAAVIRNSKHLKDIAFKTAALCVVQDSSSLIPTIALDQDLAVQQMFEDGGVLLALGEKDLMYV